MSTSTLQQIERIFYPGWLLVSQLRGGQEIHDGERLYRHACRLVEEAYSALTAAGYSKIQQENMVYALCALLDESVLNRRITDDGYLTWRRDPLQAHFFGTLSGGEILWERIQSRLTEAVPDIAVLSCLYRTLQLGFVGQFHSQDNGQREEITRQLGEHIAPFQLTLDETLVVCPPKQDGHRRFYGVFWVMGSLALVGLWFYFSSSLTDLVNQLARLDK